MLPVTWGWGSIAPARISGEYQIHIPGGSSVGHAQNRPIFFTEVCFRIGVRGYARPRGEQVGILVRVPLQGDWILQVQQRYPDIVNRQLVARNFTHYVLLNDRSP